jgi:hypothetical protein
VPQMIDLAEVEAAMEEFRIRERGKTERPGLEGVVARGQLAALPALTIWRVNEMNRGTDANEMMNALVMVVAAALSGEIMSTAGGDQTEMFAITNRLLQGLAEEIGSILTGAADIVASRHEFKEAGRA